MVDQLSSGMIGGDFHIYPSRRQCGYIQRCVDRLVSAATLIGKGAESGEEGKHDHEGWRVCHYDATSRGVRSVEIDGEITVVHDINSDREGFASR